MTEEDDRVQTRFGRRMRAVRTAKKLSQEHVALECGLSQTYISEVESGKRNISLQNIYRIAHALEMTMAELMDGIP